MQHWLDEGQQEGWGLGWLVNFLLLLTGLCLFWKARGLCWVVLLTLFLSCLFKILFYWYFIKKLVVWSPNDFILAFGICRFCEERREYIPPVVAYVNNTHEFVSTIIILGKEAVSSLSRSCIWVLRCVYCRNKVLDILWRNFLYDSWSRDWQDRL